MSAIKTIRWEVPATFDDGEEGEEMELDTEEEYEDEDEDEDEEDAEDGYEESRSRSSASRSTSKPRVPGARVLPVADLPDDFEGEAMDGATYLALAK